MKLGPIEAGEWDAIVESSSEALAFHRHAWIQTAARLTGGTDSSRVYEWQGRKVLVPLIRAGGVGRVGVAASLPYGWGFGGVVTEGQVTASDIAMVVDDLAKSGLVRISLRPNPCVAGAWAEAVSSDTPAAARVAHVLSLEGGFPEVWAHRFVGTARTNVRRAEKSDLTVDASRSDQAIETFYRLYELSWQRWGDRRRNPAVRWLVDRRRERLEKFQAAARALGDDFTVWTAHSNDVPVAAVVVLTQPGAASYWRGAMDEALAGPTRANYLLFKLAIEAACAAGARTFHMGDTGTSASLAQFKSRFGAEPVAYREYHLERLPITAAMQRVRRIIG